ncbi:MAG: hypothetical protein J6U23_08620 [Clostridiales bacterium]|nr:hypothetical protein [Clostridiales bacterium]
MAAENDNDLTEEELKQKRRNENMKLSLLASAVKNSKDLYDDDVSSLISALPQIDDSSPIIGMARARIRRTLNERACDEDYDALIRSIRNSIT